jgi:NAD-dependent SIR2 family protein deacetylase
MDTWHHEDNTRGVTVEMHGNVRHLVCPECRTTRAMDAALAKQVGASRVLGQRLRCFVLQASIPRFSQLVGCAN